MAKSPLFNNWTWKLGMPEPFDKAASTISTAHYSSYCTVATKKATLHAPLLSAVLAYMEMDTTQLQQVLDHEDGRIALEKTDEIGEDGDGGTSRTSDYAGSGYVSQAAEDMERIMAQLAEEAAYASYEQELSEELQAESERIRYGNAHRGVHVNVNRMSYVDPAYMEAYRKVAPPLLLISRRLQKQVSQILKDYK